MTKQEWGLKFSEFDKQNLLTIGKFEHILDFFYSLHLQEIEKIRERITARLNYCEEQNGRDSCKNCGLCKEDLGLPAITDENI